MPLYSDGLHLHLVNTSATSAFAVVRPVDDPNGRTGTVGIELGGDRDTVLPIPPGEYEAACIEDTGDRIVTADIGQERFTARFFVTDPLGYWSQMNSDEQCGEPFPAPAPTAGTDVPLVAPVSGRMLVNGDSSKTFNDDIFVVQADGSGSSRVTDEGASSGGRWSPDGSRVAYSADLFNDVNGDTWTSGHLELFSSAEDGHDPQQLTDNTADDFEPSWSPDGQRIAYTSNEGGPRRLWISNADGSEPTEVPIEVDLVDSPAWSPDGAWIAFVGLVGLQEREPGQLPCTARELFIVRPDGSDLLQLTHDGLSEQSPAWSPDGTRLVYKASEQGDYTWEIFTMAIDGSDVQRLTESPAYKTTPLWSPDGRLITFASDQLPDGSAPSDDGGSPSPLTQYVMNSDGSGVSPLFDARIIDLTADDSVTATDWRA